MSAEIIATLRNSIAFLMPELVLGFAACVLFLGATIRADRNVWALFSLVALCAAGICAGLVNASTVRDLPAIYAAPIFRDDLGKFVRALSILGGIVLVLCSWKQVGAAQAAEYYACLLIIVAGLSLVGMANDLVTLFLALELISIPTYILLYLPRHDLPAQEAAMKYFLLSVFSSALLLFGFSYLYGLVGTTNIAVLMETLTADSSDLPGTALIALVMVVAGLSFKITAVPFHFYAPDVYQGTPTVAAAMLAFHPKVAGFVGVIRLLGFVWAGTPGGGQALGSQAVHLLWILAAVTMTLGNLLALLQHNLKRLLAYSSVAHAGYMLIGLTVAHRLTDGSTSLWLPGGVQAVLYYLAAYGAMTIGAFSVLAYLSTSQRPVEMEDDLSGLSRSHPGVALLMTLFLFSLIGVPLTAGFAGKLFLLLGAVAAPGPESHPWLFRILAVIAVLNAAVGAWYYLRIIAKMYLHTPIKPLEKPRCLPGLTALWICALITLALGVYPNLLLGRAAVRRVEPNTGLLSLRPWR